MEAVARAVDQILKLIPPAATAILAVGPILGGVVAAGGGFSRLSRNALSAVELAINLLTVASALAALALIVYLLGGSKRIAASVTVLSLLFTSGAFLEFVHAAVWSAAVQEQVDLDAAVSTAGGELSLRGTATTTGARAGDRLIVEVWGQRLVPEGKAYNQIWTGHGGPSADGTISVEIQTPVPPSLGFEAVIVRAFTPGVLAEELGQEPGFAACLVGRPSASGISGCMTLALPDPFAEPQLLGSVTGADDSRVVRVELRAVQLRRTDRVLFWVHGLKDNDDPELIQSGWVSPNPSGVVTADYDIHVGTQFNSVCIAATRVGFPDQAPTPDSPEPSAQPSRQPSAGVPPSLPALPESCPVRETRSPAAPRTWLLLWVARGDNP